MTQKKGDSDPVSQSDRFKEAARELGCDESEAHFEENLKKVAAHKPSKIENSDAKPHKPRRNKL